MRCISALIAVMSFLPCAAAAEVLELAAMPGEGPVKLTLSADLPALVEETREVYIQAGTNRLRFDWSKERIEAGSVQVRVEPPVGGIATIAAIVRPHRSPNRIYFEVESSVEGAGRVAISYLLHGIGWKVDYLGLLAEAEDRLDVRLVADLNNQSGMDFRGAEAALTIGRIGSIDLDHGSGCRLEMLAAPGIPVAKTYTFDAGRTGGRVVARLKLKNDAASGLGTIDLPAGKISLFKAPPGGGAPALLGEDIFPAVAKGEEGEFAIGDASDVAVERKVLKSVRENERRDRWNTVVVFDQRERLSFEITNHRPAPLELKVVERLADTWEIVEKGRDFEKKDAGTIEFIVPVAASGKEIFEIESVRRDLW